MKRNIRRRRSTHSTTRSSQQLEVRQMLSAVSAEVETAASIDGAGNNIDNPEFGSTDVELLRLSSVEYEDGISSPAGEDRVSAREVSNEISAQSESVLNARGLTDYIWIWGQFLDHDIDLTENAEPEEEFNIEVPLGDAYFDPFGTGEAVIGLNRSVYAEDDTGDGVRQQINQITAFIDGSVIYGSDQERADALRTFEGGLLKTSDGDYLPYNTEGYANAGGPSDTLYLAGDIRANENVALTSMHTIFVREHNRIASEMAARDPLLSDEELYQRARAIVRAELQAITYNEFLPALLGQGALDEYTGYDPSVNPGIANEFSTAAYRFGHSLLSPELQRLDADGNVIEDGNLSLSEAFFRPDEVAEQGIDSILRGAASQLAQELDTGIIDDVRNFLFGPPGSGGLDLASLNIQRGRDHGLADYNQTRVDLGLDPVTSFDQITSNPELAAALEETYGTVDDIDLWVAGLAEDHVSGSSLGETFQTIIVDQFERLRDGDRYWYQNVMSGRQLREIENTTLADIIERNTDIDGLQGNIFFEESSPQNNDDGNPDPNRRRRERVRETGRSRDRRNRERAFNDDRVRPQTNRPIMNAPINRPMVDPVPEMIDPVPENGPETDVPPPGPPMVAPPLSMPEMTRLPPMLIPERPMADMPESPTLEVPEMPDGQTPATPPVVIPNQQDTNEPAADSMVFGPVDVVFEDVDMMLDLQEDVAAETNVQPDAEVVRPLNRRAGNERRTPGSPRRRGRGPR